MTTATKLSCAALRKLLPVGTEFTATYVVTYVGPFKPSLSSRRRVVKQTPASMASLVLDGPKANHTFYCDWRGVTARAEDGAIILTNNQMDPAEDFLSITF